MGRRGAGRGGEWQGGSSCELGCDWLAGWLYVHGWGGPLCEWDAVGVQGWQWLSAVDKAVLSRQVDRPQGWRTLCLGPSHHLFAGTFPQLTASGHRHPRLRPCLAPLPAFLLVCPACCCALPGAEAAMEWVFAHMGDPDFNDPLPQPGQQQQPGELTAGAAATSRKALSPCVPHYTSNAAPLSTPAQHKPPTTTHATLLPAHSPCRSCPLPPACLLQLPPLPPQAPRPCPC